MANISKVELNGTTYTVKDSESIPTSAKGAANGVASLDSSGKVPSSQLPSSGGGSVDTVYVGTNEYPPDSNGKVSLPAYPTTLPANGGTASNVSGTVAIANGGTGATSASLARSNLGLGSAATKSSTTSVTSGSSSLVTSGGVYEALSGKQNTISDLSTIRSGANAGATALQPSDITTLSNKVDTLYSGIVLVKRSIASGVTAQISHTATGNDFNTGASGSKYSGTYLLSCVNWSTTPQAYLGLITFTGNKPGTLAKVDIVTGFTPTISLTSGTISVSGCGRISLYAIK